MANPPRAKGTGGEREVLRSLARSGVTVYRSPASATVDLYREAGPDIIHALATRPDGGRWLVTLPLDELANLLTNQSLQIEVKRYRRFSLHTLFERKFGR